MLPPDCVQLNLQELRGVTSIACNKRINLAPLLRMAKLWITFNLNSLIIIHIIFACKWNVDNYSVINNSDSVLHNLM